jgi:hypothetical protein
MSRTATCRCGACTIEVEGAPTVNLICHCTSCRRRTGAPCGWSAIFREGQVLDRRGDFRIYPGFIGCAGGCFVDDPLDEPTVSASHDLRCAWLQLPDSWEIRISDA